MAATTLKARQAVLYPEFDHLVQKRQSVVADVIAPSPRHGI